MLSNGLIAHPSSSKTIDILDLKGKQVRKLFVHDENGSYKFLVPMSRNRLAIVYSNHVVIHDPKIGRLITFEASQDYINKMLPSPDGKYLVAHTLNVKQDNHTDAFITLNYIWVLDPDNNISKTTFVKQYTSLYLDKFIFDFNVLESHQLTLKTSSQTRELEVARHPTGEKYPVVAIKNEVVCHNICKINLESDCCLEPVKTLFVGPLYNYSTMGDFVDCPNRVLACIHNNNLVFYKRSQTQELKEIMRIPHVNASIAPKRCSDFLVYCNNANEIVKLNLFSFERSIVAKLKEGQSIEVSKTGKLIVCNQKNMIYMKSKTMT